MPYRFCDYDGPDNCYYSKEDGEWCCSDCGHIVSYKRGCDHCREEKIRKKEEEEEMARRTRGCDYCGELVDSADELTDVGPPLDMRMCIGCIEDFPHYHWCGGDSEKPSGNCLYCGGKGELYFIDGDRIREYDCGHCNSGECPCEEQGIVYHLRPRTELELLAETTKPDEESEYDADDGTQDERGYILSLCKYFTKEKLIEASRLSAQYRKLVIDPKRLQSLEDDKIFPITFGLTENGITFVHVLLNQRNETSLALATGILDIPTELYESLPVIGSMNVGPLIVDK